jgi:hypothetical protein
MEGGEVLMVGESRNWEKGVLYIHSTYLNVT